MPKTNPDTKLVQHQIYLTQPQTEYMRLLQKKEGRSISELIRIATDLLLADRGGINAKKQDTAE